jgi:uncharacterized membrane protein
MKMKCVNVLKGKTGMGMMAAVMMAAMLSGSAVPVSAAESGIDMSTEYSGVTVKAGGTISFSLDFASLDGEGHDIALSVESMPDEWSGYFKGGSNEVTRVHINGSGDEEASSITSGLATFSLTVPDEATEGTYTVELKADAGSGDTDVLELEISVNEQEAGQSTFSSEYPEQEGASGTVFSFDTTIVNNRSTAQSYALSAQTPEGWQVKFTPSGESTNVVSVEVEAGSSLGMTITVTPTEMVEKGEYTIPVSAISSEDSLSEELAVNITGTYDVQLSTSDGRLSCDAYANKGTNITLTVTNNGNVDLENLNLQSSVSTGWDVEFSESTIELLEAGASKEITATVTPSDNVITGDYVAVLSISNDLTSDSAEFRVTVKTTTTWGIVAIAIIVVLVLGLAGIFKKYGRR